MRREKEWGRRDSLSFFCSCTRGGKKEHEAEIEREEHDKRKGDAEAERAA